MARAAIALILILALTAAPALGATVTTKYATSTSIKHIFTYSPGDEATVVTDVAPNDYIVIEYGAARAPLERRYFMKTRTGDVWSYDVVGAETGLQLRLGEQVMVDLDADGTPELSMLWKNSTRTKGAFVFAGPAPQQAPAAVQPAAAEPPAEPAAGIEGKTAPLAAAAEQLAIDSQAQAAEPEATQPDMTGITGSATGGSDQKPPRLILVVGAAVALMLLIGGIYFLRRKGDKEEKEESVRPGKKLPKIIE